MASETVSPSIEPSEKTKAANEEKSGASVLAAVNTIDVGSFNNYTITGKLVYAETDKPAKNVEVPLVALDGTIIKTTNTNEHGEFKYSNLPSADNYKILAGSTKTKLTDKNSLIVKDLKVAGYNNEVSSLDFDKIYFDVNSAELKPESNIVLDKLVVFYQKNPNAQIEINAFTDMAGSDELNLKLSEKRGKAAYDYLQSKGIDRTALVVKARGKKLPVSLQQQ
jgi:peptidoglycan-associated lipoprotein